MSIRLRLAGLLIEHTRLSDSGKCSCGATVPLGHSFAAHQADAVIATFGVRKHREHGVWHPHPGGRGVFYYADPRHPEAAWWTWETMTIATDRVPERVDAGMSSTTYSEEARTDTGGEA